MRIKHNAASSHRTLPMEFRPHAVRAIQFRGHRFGARCRTGIRSHRWVWPSVESFGSHQAHLFAPRPTALAYHGAQRLRGRGSNHVAATDLHPNLVEDARTVTRPDAPDTFRRLKPPSVDLIAVRRRSQCHPRGRRAPSRGTNSPSERPPPISASTLTQ